MKEVLLAAALVLCLSVISCSKSTGDSPKAAPDPAVPVTVTRVEMVALDQTLSVSGTLFPKDEATLSAEVEGQVEKTLVEFGDRVKAGQVLAQIDTMTYQALARQTEANLARARANAANAQRNLPG